MLGVDFCWWALKCSNWAWPRKETSCEAPCEKESKMKKTPTYYVGLDVDRMKGLNMVSLILVFYHVTCNWIFDFLLLSTTLLLSLIQFWLPEIKYTKTPLYAKRVGYELCAEQFHYHNISKVSPKSTTIDQCCSNLILLSILSPLKQEKYNRSSLAWNVDCNY